MSIENHPNFHSVAFAGDITSSFHECLRGGADVDWLNEAAVREEILNFVGRMEDLADASDDVSKRA